MKQPEDMFRGAVPGISLTKEPGSYPWERPPEMEDPDEVIKFYLERFTREEPLENAMIALEGGFPLRALVEGVMTSGVSRGLHTIDMSLIVAPVVHEFLKGEADRLGVEYDEGIDDTKAKEERRNKYRMVKLMKRLEKIEKEGPKEETASVTEELFETEETAKDELKEEIKEEPKGLMARRK